MIRYAIFRSCFLVVMMLVVSGVLVAVHQLEYCWWEWREDGKMRTIQKYGSADLRVDERYSVLNPSLFPFGFSHQTNSVLYPG